MTRAAAKRTAWGETVQKELEKRKREVRVIYVGTYIPRECGIATYTKDLTTAINILNPHYLAEIVAINEPDGHYDYPWEVKYRIEQEEPKSYIDAASYINQSSAPIVSIQHEFGIFGGEDGEYILPFLDSLEKLVVTTLHTVLPEPSPNHKRIIRKIAEFSQALVVMAEVAAERLVTQYGLDEKKLIIVPHGVPDISYGPTYEAKKTLKLDGKKILLTFGLINPGKGIEYAISALPEIIKKEKDILYLILGETHPMVKKKEGEKYRESLVELVRKLKLKNYVHFENQYLNLEELILYLKATDLYLTPFLNPNQITSGTLAYALGAGKACISTPYIYAEEVLGNGRGVLVPFKSSEKIAQAILDLLGDSEKRKKMEKRAYLFGRKMIWPKVALDYLDLFWLIVKETKGNLSDQTSLF